MFLRARSSYPATDFSAKMLKKQLDAAFFKKGVIIAVFSGMCYGLYTAFMTLGMTKGVWADWYGNNSVLLSAFVVTYMLGALGSAVNDSMSAVWALGHAGLKGKLGDFVRCLWTKPGRIMMLAAAIGGPISSAAYVIGIQLAGSIAVPISALCPAIGAVLARILFKQKLNGRMLLGIFICVFAGFIISTTAVGQDAPEGRLLGIMIALIAAFGWGLEGCIAGYSSTLIDYEIGITIRQCTSGLGNLCVLMPIFALIGNEPLTLGFQLFAKALGSSAMIFFIISGFFALFAYGLWYKGNSMCGTALGMACNGMFSFWGPFFCWIILGIFAGLEGWGLPPIAWIAAIIMAMGIFIIAENPLKLIRHCHQMKLKG